MIKGNGYACTQRVKELSNSLKQYFSLSLTAPLFSYSQKQLFDLKIISPLEIYLNCSKLHALLLPHVDFMSCHLLPDEDLFLFKTIHPTACISVFPPIY